MPFLMKASLVMFWCRLGSLHALEMLGKSRFWKQWLGRPPASAKTMGRIHAGLDAGGLRPGLRHVYSRLKRNSHASSLQCLTKRLLLPVESDRFFFCFPARLRQAAEWG